MLRLDAVYPTLEQEAPHVASPRRAVEVFTQEKHVCLRVGPVEGVDPAHGSYTLLLSRNEAREIAEALRKAGEGAADRQPPKAIVPGV